MQQLIKLAWAIAFGVCTLAGCSRSGLDDSPASARPWIWKSEQYGFEVTVPSERWEKRKHDKLIALFGGSDFMAMVAEVRPAETDAEWQSALQFAQRMRVGKSAANVEEKNGANGNGLPFWLFAADVQDGSRSYFIGMSITRVRGKGIVMMFEGKPQTDANRAAQQRQQAIQFLNSVK